MTHPLCLHIINHKAQLFISNEVWLKFSLVSFWLDKRINYGLLKNLHLSFIHFISVPFAVFRVLAQVLHFQVTLTILVGLAPFDEFLLVPGLATTVSTCAKSRATSESNSVVVSSTFAQRAISFNWPTTMSYSSNRLQEPYSFSIHTLQIHGANASTVQYETYFFRVGKLQLGICSIPQWYESSSGNLLSVYLQDILQLFLETSNVDGLWQKTWTPGIQPSRLPLWWDVHLQ